MWDIVTSELTRYYNELIFCCSTEKNFFFFLAAITGRKAARVENETQTELMEPQMT